ncbi:hypothetical protein D3C81_1733610 [compost metagenome]
MLMTVVSEYMLYRKIRNSSSGLSVVSSRHTKKAKARTPKIRQAYTVALFQPSVPASLKPYSKPPKPRVDKTTPILSSLGEVNFPTFCIVFMPSSVEKIASGSTM